MLLNEHTVMYNDGRCDEMIPYWLRYVKDDGKIIYGPASDDINALQFDIESAIFHADPIGYRDEREK